MDDVKEIAKPSFRLVRDSEHYYFHEKVLQVITSSIAKEYKIEHLRFDYEKMFKREEKAFLRNRGFEETKEIQAADKKRDELFCFIKRTIELMKYNPETEMKIFWDILDKGLNPYKNAHRKSFEENTELITLFIQEMKKEEYAEAVEMLDLEKVFDLLEDANRKCGILYNERLSSKEKRTKEDKIRLLRPRVDKAFFAIIKVINAIYLVSYLVTKEESIVKQIGDVVDKINGYTAELQQNIKGRRE
jgi:hypothetical protein